MSPSGPSVAAISGFITPDWSKCLWETRLLGIKYIKIEHRIGFGILVVHARQQVVCLYPYTIAFPIKQLKIDPIFPTCANRYAIQCIYAN